MNKRILGVLALPLVALSTTPAMAAAVDVTALTADIAAQAAPVAAVAGAVLLIFIGMKAFKWIRRAAG